MVFLGWLLDMAFVAVPATLGGTLLNSTIILDDTAWMLLRFEVRKD